MKPTPPHIAELRQRLTENSNLHQACFTEEMIALVEEEGELDTASEMRSANKRYLKDKDARGWGKALFIFTDVIPAHHRELAAEAVASGHPLAAAANSVIRADYKAAANDFVEAMAVLLEASCEHVGHNAEVPKKDQLQ